ncbi:MAG: DUF2807 domain-containing protein [Myxococcales bacterium]|nr:DUF2807 domain-containing protein [Myxococcales bacterium]
MRYVLCLLLAFAVSCNPKVILNFSGLAGSGQIKVESRAVDLFTAVELSGAFKVNIGVTDAPTKLELRGDDNLLPHVTAKVENGVLKLATDVAVSPSHELAVTLQTAKLDRLQVSGAGKVHASGLHGDTFLLRVSGAASVRLAGEVSSTTLELSGASSVQAGDLTAARVKIDLSGAGKATVWASESLDVAVSGAGSVVYGGKPKEVTKKITGVGVLRADDSMR